MGIRWTRGASTLGFACFFDSSCHLGNWDVSLWLMGRIRGFEEELREGSAELWRLSLYLIRRSLHEYFCTQISGEFQEDS